METIICIDYGTGMSKVAASIDGESPFPIPLGECERDPVKEFPIDSSLLFSTDGRIYMGSCAVRKSLEIQDAPERRLDSLKRRLTTGDQTDLTSVLLPGEFNRTESPFSLADALALMLAHILRLTHDYLRAQYGEEALEGAVYRFTRPVFDSERSEWVDRHMFNAIAQGIQLEGRLGKLYEASIEAKRARQLLNELGSESPAQAFISKRGLVEPIAAGTLVLSQVPDRRFLAVVVDIGAGTTDIALFAGIQPHGKATVDRVRTQGSPVSVAKAGDRIDELLTKVIERNVEGGLTRRDRIEIDLNIRRWKEDIFKFQETVPTLSGGHLLSRITLHSFLQEPDVAKFQEELIEALFGVLRSADQTIDNYATFSQFPHTHIEVVPCGGGANLPIFKEIAKRQWKTFPSGKTLGFDVKKPVPIGTANYDENYPQLAVALGGALRDQPIVNGLGPRSAPPATHR